MISRAPTREALGRIVIEPGRKVSPLTNDHHLIVPNGAYLRLPNNRGRVKFEDGGEGIVGNSGNGPVIQVMKEGGVPDREANLVIVAASGGYRIVSMPEGANPVVRPGFTAMDFAGGVRVEVSPGSVYVIAKEAR